MKKFTLFLLFFGMVFIHQAIAQERQIIQGYCKDENGKAIENVSVYVQDSLLVSVTDENGRFTYGFAKAGCIMTGLTTITRRERRFGEYRDEEILGIHFTL